VIAASFDRTKSAAVSGVYQYDTGQRLVMHGMPSPEEMAGQDELLSGDLVTVQAQFSYCGDSQAQMRLAIWDEKRQAWICDVPDEYLTRHKDVHVYVYLYYGADETGERAQTAYEATFRPISRPAPEGVVTQEQIDQWTEIKAEIEISMSKAGSAIDGANDASKAADEAGNAAAQAAEDAQAAAKAAQDAKDELQDAGGDLGYADGGVKALPAGSEATAELELTEPVGRLVIGAPAGANGIKGQTGDTGPADITISFDEETGTLVTATIDEGSEA